MSSLVFTFFWIVLGCLHMGAAKGKFLCLSGLEMSNLLTEKELV